MRNAMINFLLVWIGLIICFANTFGHDLWIALSVAGIFAVCTLHTSGIFKEVTTKSTAHNVVELLGNEFMALLLVDFLLLLADSTLSVKTNIKGPSVLELFS